MTFIDSPLILTSTLFRAAFVSTTRGTRVIDSLRSAGRITPTRTPTGRELLTPSDGAVAFQALTTEKGIDKLITQPWSIRPQIAFHAVAHFQDENARDRKNL